MKNKCKNSANRKKLKYVRRVTETMTVGAKTRKLMQHL